MTHKQKRTLICISITVVLLIAAVILNAVFELSSLLRLFIYLIPYGIIALRPLRKACTNIAHGQFFDENLLMAIATIGALCIGEYPEAVFVMLFYQVGELFESIAVGRSRRSISALMEIRPDHANVQRGEDLITVSPEEVEIDEIIVIKPGDRIPLDGIVTTGTTNLDTAALTGESMPHFVKPGDKIASGCVNLSGVIRVRVTGTYEQSTVAKILELVQNSSSNKAKSEAFITRFSRYYTPAVVLCALLLAVIPSMITGSWSEWVRRALLFLVVSCPCALVISVPLTFFGGIGAASKCGILIKGSDYLERLADLDTVVFDKTGTLTRGRFHVTAVHPNEISQEMLLETAAAAEYYSTHPISVALREAYHGAIRSEKIGTAEELAGLGIHVPIEGKTVCVGNGKLMELAGCVPPDCPHDGTVVHVSIDGVYAGHIAIEDEIKPDSADAVSALKKLGVRKTVMLTGDREEIAKKATAVIGIDESHAGLLPQGKVEKVEQLLKEKTGGTLAFVGDGINDAPVLARADLGIAMGALGSDAAIEAADVVLMDDQPSKLPLAVGIARKTRRIAYQNIVFALSVKFLVLLLSAFGLANMWGASFADVGVSVIAILNATRALRCAK